MWAEKNPKYFEHSSKVKQHCPQTVKVETNSGTFLIQYFIRGYTITLKALVSITILATM